MKTLKFKSNINCSSCVAKVTTTLNESVGEGNWQVDTEQADKILTVTVEEEVPAATVVNAVKKTGFKVEALEQ